MSAISSKNQVTIPRRVLDETGLSAGESVQITSAGPGRIELVRTKDLIAELAGRLGDESYSDGYLEREREGWG